MTEDRRGQDDGQLLQINAENSPKDEKAIVARRALVKERIKTIGVENLPNDEILEFVLFPFAACKDTHGLARAVLSKFITLERVLNAKEAELASVFGMPKTAALFIPTYTKIVTKAKRDALKTLKTEIFPTMAQDYYMDTIGGLPTEELRVMFLDSKRRFICDERMAAGDEVGALIDIKQIVEKAAFLNSSKIIIAHNHPSGEVTPSQADITFTKQLVDLMVPLNVQVLDHIIVSKRHYHSMWENQNNALAVNEQECQIAEYLQFPND